MARKFIYYLKGFSRTIVLTDKDEDKPIEEITSKISKLMSGCKVSKFETDKDILIVRPSDIIGVHINMDYSKQNDYQEESLDENIRLQNIVPEIDLGNIDTNDDLDVKEIFEEKVENTIEEVEESEDEESTEELEDDIVESD